MRSSKAMRKDSVITSAAKRDELKGGLTGFGKQCSVSDQHIATRPYATSTPAMGDNISLYGQSLQQSETRDESRIEGGHRVSRSVRGDNSTLELEGVS